MAAQEPFDHGRMNWDNSNKAEAITVFDGI